MKVYEPPRAWGCAAQLTRPPAQRFAVDQTPTPQLHHARDATAVLLRAAALPHGRPWPIRSSIYTPRSARTSTALSTWSSAVRAMRCLARRTAC
jgi:hypothetical protein